LPSRHPDLRARPRGTRTAAHPTKSRDRGKRRENESAEALAQHGYHVEQNPPPRPNGREPDYLVEGRYADCYAPNTGDLDNIRDQISKKVKGGQADRIVLNLDDYPGDTGDVAGVLRRKPIGGLKEVIVVRRGTVTPFFPFDEDR
jgi:hypothetical protein